MAKKYHVFHTRKCIMTASQQASALYTPPKTCYTESAYWLPGGIFHNQVGH